MKFSSDAIGTAEQNNLLLLEVCLLLVLLLEGDLEIQELTHAAESIVDIIMHWLQVAAIWYVP